MLQITQMLNCIGQNSHKPCADNQIKHSSYNVQNRARVVLRFSISLHFFHLCIVYTWRLGLLGKEG